MWRARVYVFIIRVLFYFQTLVNSTTTDDGDAPSLNVDLSIIPVQESTSASFQPQSDDEPPVLQSYIQCDINDSASASIQPVHYDEPPLLQSYLECDNNDLDYDEPPVLQSCMEIPTPAHFDSHDSAIGDLIGMSQRSGDHIMYE